MKDIRKSGSVSPSFRTMGCPGGRIDAVVADDLRGRLALLDLERAVAGAERPEDERRHVQPGDLAAVEGERGPRGPGEAALGVEGRDLDHGLHAAVDHLAPVEDP